MVVSGVVGGVVVVVTSVVDCDEGVTGFAGGFTGEFVAGGSVG